MSCCPATIVPFALADKTSVGYNGEYGATPKVDVIYLIAGVWQPAGVMTTIEQKPNEITVYHGGYATGIIKIW